VADADSPIHWSASDIARRIAEREISALQVAQAHIARIEEVNPRLNAIVVPRFEEALKEAATADERQARGEPLGPLHGVPMTLKECFHLAGTPSTIGLDRLRHELLPEDGILVRRLRRAGAIVLGKTNLAQLMIWHESDNPVYGRSNNPWDFERTPGGSSGGEAAIIAARGSPLGLGNDLGGSIRVPCHFCGIHGIRPTSHRLPRVGARRTLRGFEAVVTQPGPLARHVEDLWLALQVLADDSDGEVSGDTAPGKLRDPADVEIRRLRIAAWTNDGVFPPSLAVERAVREAAAALRDAGSEVMELDPAEVNRLLHTNEAFDLYCGLVGSDGAADARRLTRGSALDWRVARLLWLAGMSLPLRGLCLAALQLTGQKWPARIARNARPRSADAYWRLTDQQAQLAARCVAALRQGGFHALLCPPYALAAPHHVETFDLLPAASYSMIMNLLGFPAGVVSVTRARPSEDARSESGDLVLRRAQSADRGSVGLPIGVQVATFPWREDIVLAVMAALQAAFFSREEYPGRLIVPKRVTHP
jgi:fatty acid amide hydrolase